VPCPRQGKGASGAEQDLEDQHLAELQGDLGGEQVVVEELDVGSGPEADGHRGLAGLDRPLQVAGDIGSRHAHHLVDGHRQRRVPSVAVDAPGQSSQLRRAVCVGVVDLGPFLGKDALPGLPSLLDVLRHAGVNLAPD